MRKILNSKDISVSIKSTLKMLNNFSVFFLFFPFIQTDVLTSIKFN